MKRGKRFGRWLFVPAGQMFRLYARVRPHTRVRVVIRTGDDEILMVKNWLSQQRWSVPGGGINRGETPENAAIREVHEETGLIFKRSQLKLVGMFENEDDKAPIHLMVFEIHLPKQPLPPIALLRRLEIIDRAWLPLEIAQENKLISWYQQIQK